MKCAGIREAKARLSQLARAAAKGPTPIARSVKLLRRFRAFPASAKSPPAPAQGRRRHWRGGRSIDKAWRAQGTQATRNFVHSVASRLPWRSGTIARRGHGFLDLASGQRRHASDGGGIPPNAPLSPPRSPAPDRSASGRRRDPASQPRAQRATRETTAEVPVALSEMARQRPPQRLRGSLRVVKSSARPRGIDFAERYPVVHSVLSSQC